jgi:tetratricopeptide (TPR) repeat protein
MEDIRRAALPIIDAQFGLFHDDAGPGNAFWPRQTIVIAKKLHDLKLLSREGTHEKLNYAIQWIQENPGPDAKIAEERLNLSRMFLACIYNDYKEFTSADAVLRQVEEWLESGGCVNDNQRVNCIEIRAELDANWGRLESAEFHYKKALYIAQELLSAKDPSRIGFSFTALENFYLENGNTAAAQAVRQGYNMHLQSMVGEPRDVKNLLLEESKEQGDMVEDVDSE